MFKKTDWFAEDKYGSLQPKWWKLIPALIIGLIAFVVVLAEFPLGTVGAGERGVLLRWSAVSGIVKQEGLYFRMPFYERVVIMDVQIQKEQVPAPAASKDLQSVESEVALNYHINPEAVSKIYQEVRTDYKIRIVDPAIQEAVKASTAQFSAEELLTKREAVRNEIKLLLTEKLAPRGIVVDELNIVSFDFSQSFNQAIEAKVRAEQDALTQKNKLEQVKYEAEQQVAEAKGNAEARITNAKAEAEAIKIQAQAITQQGGADYVQLQAIKQWNGALPTTMIPGAVVPFLNLNR